jgi:porphobilinogen synthase
MVRETKLSAHDFILPFFVSEKLQERRAIVSMPGVFQLSVRDAVEEAQQAYSLGLQAVSPFRNPCKQRRGRIGCACGRRDRAAGGARD